ncbi:MAG: hypothetical protein WB822_03770, partial [Rhodoplanes sp.]
RANSDSIGTEFALAATNTFAAANCNSIALLRASAPSSVMPSDQNWRIVHVTVAAAGERDQCTKAKHFPPRKVIPPGCTFDRIRVHCTDSRPLKALQSMHL